MQLAHRRATLQLHRPGGDCRPGHVSPPAEVPPKPAVRQPKRSPARHLATANHHHHQKENETRQRQGHRGAGGGAVLCSRRHCAEVIFVNVSGFCSLIVRARYVCVPASPSRPASGWTRCAALSQAAGGRTAAPRHWLPCLAAGCPRPVRHRAPRKPGLAARPACPAFDTADVTAAPRAGGRGERSKHNKAAKSLLPDLRREGCLQLLVAVRQ